MKKRTRHGGKQEKEKREMERKNVIKSGHSKPLLIIYASIHSWFLEESFLFKLDSIIHECHPQTERTQVNL